MATPRWIVLRRQSELRRRRWRIGLLVSLLCAVLPIIVSFSFGRKNLLWVYGVIAAFPLFGAYYLLGIVFCFYYLLFAPLPAIVHWSALAGGILLTLYWMVMSWQTVSHTIAATTFVTRAFTETAADFQYQPQSAMVLFERLHKERLPFPKIYMYIVLGIGPFGLLLERLLSSSFGTGGVLFLLAVLSMPLSLWFAGVLVRAYLVMVPVDSRSINKEAHATLGRRDRDGHPVVLDCSFEYLDCQCAAITFKWDCFCHYRLPECVATNSSGKWFGRTTSRARLEANMPSALIL